MAANDAPAKATEVLTADTAPKNTLWKAIKPFLNGGASGMLATCVIQPVDMVKVRLQLGATGSPVRTPPEHPPALRLTLYALQNLRAPTCDRKACQSSVHHQWSASQLPRWIIHAGTCAQSATSKPETAAHGCSSQSDPG